MLKTAIAVAAGKLSARMIQLLHAGSGTQLPGRVALRFDDRLLEHLGRTISKKTLAVTGTNGKSTTAGLISKFIEASGGHVVHNQLGANMVPGIATALLKKSSLLGKVHSDYGVFEVDEASLPLFAQSIKQDLTLVTNLFRDQLDRYGELDTTAKLIRKGISISGGKLILNADDPIVTSIAAGFSPDMVRYYGVRAVHYPGAPEVDFPVPFPREVTDCPMCQAELEYTITLYGHLGHYACHRCGFKRPKPWLEAERIDVSVGQSQVSLICDGEPLGTYTARLPGLFNAYNFVAAASVAMELGLKAEHLEAGLSGYHGIFGRAEEKRIQGKLVKILLIKNPIGASEVLKVVAGDPNGRLVIMINDNYADGRDISWLWDAPFEVLANQSKPILVSGRRAEDMAVRLQYAGVLAERLIVEPTVMKAFQQGIDSTQADETLYVLPTYTALLHLSQEIHSR